VLRIFSQSLILKQNLQSMLKEMSYEQTSAYVLYKKRAPWCEKENGGVYFVRVLPLEINRYGNGH